ncbi:hypothetical protein PUN28_015635 [Cardiocondyla obscurior]|uniref:Secreted protein n=1 Tax=Cardiocondyla obscurior TaxID=286306 RepID=A0AAW2EXX1_9HYME
MPRSRSLPPFLCFSFSWSSVIQGGASHDQKTDVSVLFVPPRFVLLPVAPSRSRAIRFEVRAPAERRKKTAVLLRVRERRSRFL